MTQTLGDRMKTYEAVYQQHVIRRTPTIIRLDGRAFHTFTKRYLKDTIDTPFSISMHAAMANTTSWLVSNVQNCVCGYTQSDEISLLLVDWQNHETQQWFDGKVQKVASVSASMATAAFNSSAALMGITSVDSVYDMATFDSRVFSLPESEVVNYFIWRQQDASRNSVQMLGHFHFSQKEMEGKNNSQVQDMLMLGKGINWNDIATWAKRGTVVFPNPDRLSSAARTIVDEEIPIFTQDRNYLEKFMEVTDVSDILT
jgi:tRNA(His) 5'-end guanylyltransferase